MAEHYEIAKLKAAHAADLALLEARLIREAEAKVKEAEAEAKQAEAKANAEKEVLANLRASIVSPSPAVTIQEKPKWAFKMGDVDSFNKGYLKIQDFVGFVGIHYNLASPLSNGAPLEGRIRENGKLITSDTAKKIGEWKEKCEELKGQLIVIAACGKHGEKHGGEVRRIVGDYTYDTSLLSSRHGPFYHRFTTEHVRKLTPVEFEKVIGPQLGTNPNDRYRICWPIDI
jgi:hypothetical protein